MARDTFEALDCRDVARVDLRIDPKGDIYVIEVNPLPGLTPGYSDLCLIATAAGIDYRTLIGEILAGGLKRLREKRRADAAKNAESQGAGVGKSDAKSEGRSQDERQLAIPRLLPNGTGNGAATPAPTVSPASTSGATTPVPLSVAPAPRLE